MSNNEELINIEELLAKPCCLACGDPINEFFNLLICLGCFNGDVEDFVEQITLLPEDDDE